MLFPFMRHHIYVFCRGLHTNFMLNFGEAGMLKQKPLKTVLMLFSSVQLIYVSRSLIIKIITAAPTRIAASSYV